ncbi:MAG: septal ring lytic transglycosylase RlpA family protein [Myxococcota bacterium]|jgi:rare lipoprotein A|nr:septal ring lytic transglycosylase RlpA family protein [Myxococcota bacterium]
MRLVALVAVVVLSGACGGAAPSATARRAPEHDSEDDAGSSTLAREHGRDAGAPDLGGPSDPAERIVDVREGRASYYSDRLAGRSTASGEPYQPTELTAASRDLPFGTRVRVHRLDADGRSVASVVVRVNDRGPFRDHARILDLSRAAAEALDMIRAGVVSIRAEVLAD